MLSAKDITSIPDFSQIDEIEYQFDEMRFHLKHLSASLQEAEFHLKRFNQYHLEVLKLTGRNYV